MTAAQRRTPPIDLTRHPRAALVGAVVVVLATAAIVVVLGLIPFPDLPSVAERPDPPIGARLAVLEWDDGTCLEVVDDRGARHEVRCGADVEGFALRWVDDRTVAVDGGRYPDASTHVDVETGEVEVVPAEGAGPEPARDDAAAALEARHGRLLVDEQDGRIRLEVRPDDGPPRTVLQLDGPETYGLRVPRWSEDGRWVVVQDTIGRVLVVPAEGGAARVWAEADGEVAVR